MFLFSHELAWKQLSLIHNAILHMKLVTIFLLFFANLKSCVRPLAVLICDITQHSEILRVLNFVFRTRCCVIYLGVLCEFPENFPA